MALFLEGIRSVSQACTLPLLLAALVFMIAAGRHGLAAVIAYLFGAGLVAWARFAAVLPLGFVEDHAVVGALIVLVAVLLVGLASEGPTRQAFVVAGAALGGGVGAVVWRPCVGTEFGTVLNNAQTQTLPTLLPMMIYVAGVGLIALAIGLVPLAVPRVARIMNRQETRWAGTGLGVLLALAMATGLWGELIEELLVVSTS